MTFHFLGFFHRTVSNLFFCSVTLKTISRLPITPTFKGNRKKFELSKQMAGSKGKTSFYCTVNILITVNCRNGG